LRSFRNKESSNPKGEQDEFEKDKARYRSYDHYKEEIMAAAENTM